jgi:hypothetical protein
MVRRRMIEEPMSRLAVWSLRLALFSLMATFIAIIVVRSGALDFVPALSTLAGALLLAVVAIVLALAAGVGIWREGYGGMRYAIGAALIGLALIAYPAYQGTKAYRLPQIYDVTTDPIDPPQFDVLAKLRPRDANPIGYEGLYAADLQHVAYPDIDADETTATPQEAFDAAMKIIAKRRWRVVNARPPQAPATGRVADAQTASGAAGGDGVIEAVAHSLILGFPEDVVVRIRATADGTRIDARSVSRYGRTDLGSNAQRVGDLIGDVDDLLSGPRQGEPEPAPEPERKPPRPNVDHGRGRSVRR